MKFKVESLRLQKSQWGGYLLAIDFSNNTSTGVKISKKRFDELTELVKRKFSHNIIDLGEVNG